MYSKGVTLWTLRFLAQDDEAVLKFRHTLKVLLADPNVREVETSQNSAEPGVHSLTVHFAEGATGPKNRVLQTLDKIHGTSPIWRKSRYQVILEDALFD